MLRGNFTAAQWATIRQNPDAAPEGLRAQASVFDATLVRFFFALDDYDFYAFLEAANETRLAALRHMLMATGEFLLLDGDALLEPSALLPLLADAYRTRAAPLAT